MRTYTLHLFAKARDRVQQRTIACEDDAAAIGEAGEMLRRRRECEAVEAWSAGSEILRIGAGGRKGRIACGPTYLGRWSR